MGLLSLDLVVVGVQEQDPGVLWLRDLVLLGTTTSTLSLCGFSSLLQVDVSLNGAGSSSIGDNVVRVVIRIIIAKVGASADQSRVRVRLGDIGIACDALTVFIISKLPEAVTAIRCLVDVDSAAKRIAKTGC